MATEDIIRRLSDARDGLVKKLGGLGCASPLAARRNYEKDYSDVVKRLYKARIENGDFSVSILKRKYR